MRVIALDHLTALGASRPDMVMIAADCGYTAISPIGQIHPSMKFFDIPPLTRNGTEMRELQTRMRDTGITIHNMDGFPVMPENDWDATCEALDVAAALGTRNITTLIFDSDRARAMDTFNRLAAEARFRGMGLVIEFTPSSQLERLCDANDWIDRSDARDARILIDTLHLYRSGGSPPDIGKVPPDRIGYLQMSDTPMHGTPKELARRAVHEREVPGEGELPLLDILRMLDPLLPIGLEIPRRADADSGVSPLERARRAMVATRTLLARLHS